jgi:ArsR family transcriptional regulator, arsenate/arsenite/antimonite-responsive transcriptional repressor
MSRYRQIGGKTAVAHASIGRMTIPAELIAETSLEFPCPPLGAAELTAPEAERMAGMFKALADPVRLRLFSRVAAHQSGEASVCDIQNVGVSQPTVSHHLKKLREAGLIISERRGTWVYCRVAPGVLPAMAQMLSPRESLD